MTIWCRGTLEAQEFHLDKEEPQSPGRDRNPPGPGDKARFSIQHMGQAHAGSYRCYYGTPTNWSEPSDRLELVVTGEGHFGGLGLCLEALLRGVPPSPALGEGEPHEPAASSFLDPPANPASQPCQALW